MAREAEILRYAGPFHILRISEMSTPELLDLCSEQTLRWLTEQKIVQYEHGLFFTFFDMRFPELCNHILENEGNMNQVLLICELIFRKLCLQSELINTKE